MHRKERVFLSAVVARDVDGTNPRQVLPVGSGVGGNPHVVECGYGRLMIFKSLRPHLLLMAWLYKFTSCA
jgi:hypothetical protein